jgi:uncharacterized coiled-coil protein SlyX
VLQGHIDKLNARFENLELLRLARIARLEAKHAEMDEAVAYLNGKNTDDRLNALEKANELTAAVGRLAAVKPDAAKRTIKGGWVNVYRGIERLTGLGSLYEDKVDADTFGNGRIACIRIPDITEGEGL